jgi:hypothetical protein
MTLEEMTNEDLLDLYFDNVKWGIGTVSEAQEIREEILERMGKE